MTVEPTWTSPSRIERSGTVVAIDPDRLKSHIRDIPDWPSPGVTFRDITPLLNDVAAYRDTIDALVASCGDAAIDRVVGVEARGFLFAAPVAYALGAGFVPLRKPGKLPWQVEREEYALEYASDGLEIHVDAVHDGDRVLLIDDVLATGGTAAAASRLVQRCGGTIHAAAFVVEIAALEGRAALHPHPVVALATYS